MLIDLYEMKKLIEEMQNSEDYKEENIAVEVEKLGLRKYQEKIININSIDVKVCDYLTQQEYNNIVLYEDNSDKVLYDRINKIIIQDKIDNF